jgi:hypothetical protein
VKRGTTRDTKRKVEEVGSAMAPFQRERAAWWWERGLNEEVEDKEDEVRGIGRGASAGGSAGPIVERECGGGGGQQ